VDIFLNYVKANFSINYNKTLNTEKKDNLTIPSIFLHIILL